MTVAQKYPPTPTTIEPPSGPSGGGGGGEPKAKICHRQRIHHFHGAATGAGTTGNVAPVSGSVLVKLPGTSKFVALSSLQQIPFGSVIDAINGTVSVTSALPGGGTQTGRVLQRRIHPQAGPQRAGNSRPHRWELLGLSHREGAQSHRSAASRSCLRLKHVVRKLWANAHGKFSTQGNYAAGAVQGTEWLTEDLCEGTLIKVTRDKVAVTNLVNHRHVEVKTGHKYLAKAP